MVEVCRRADQLANELAAGEQWQRQLAALEALQIYAPMGHALGLQSLCSGLEDRCFQVCSILSVLLHVPLLLGLLRLFTDRVLKDAGHLRAVQQFHTGHIAVSRNRCEHPQAQLCRVGLGG